MNNLIKKDWNGFEIEFEMVGDQLMANATAMCKAFGKRPVNWLALESTKRYISALEAKSGNLTGDNQLVTTRHSFDAGTWIHERLILKLAQWLDVDFEIQCDTWIAELLRTGKVALQTVAPALPALPANYKQALLALVAAEEEKEQLQLANEQKQLLLLAANEKVEVLQPKAEFADVVTSAEGNMSISTAAKLLGQDKPLKFFEFLRDAGILLSTNKEKNMPSAKLMQKGYFKVISKPHTPETGRFAGKTFTNNTTEVTPRGLFYLYRVLDRLGKRVTNLETLKAQFPGVK